MPPWQEVNHEIHLYNENKWYIYHMLHCPLVLQEKLYKKVNQYVQLVRAQVCSTSGPTVVHP